ncbi:uncharacterized protein Caf1-105 [Atheta coriaria]|uniref:uncharacterized protein Caf1-105 n=1 Tax=Dalotia coriaria TaxID=877792 RepID=UPI0031F3AB25
MKCSIPEISWHNREPVLSIDIQPLNTINNDFYRMATGGSDNLVLIWKLEVQPDYEIKVSVLAELTRHQRSVNCVKWSPSGELLASADDDANIILWQLRTDNIPSLDEREDEFEEKWNALKVLRGHKEDVYDLCWSPMGDKLLSGSVDNTAILWDIAKGQSELILKDHKGFIQGVAWDSKSNYITTLCSDRVCRVFDKDGRRLRARISRGKLPVDEDNEFYEKDVKYFHDDTFKTYFRRLNFTPDGSLLLVPSGAVETEEKKNAFFGTFAFTLDALNEPVCVFPSGKQCSIAVSCCPTLFELRENGPKPVINLPYRMIIAVATDSDVILYDTQQMTPCVQLQNIHYTRLTDLTWSIDGLILAASSTDGFITLVSFEEGELGTVYVTEESDLEDSVLSTSGCGSLLLENETEAIHMTNGDSIKDSFAHMKHKNDEELGKKDIEKDKSFEITEQVPNMEVDVPMTTDTVHEVNGGQKKKRITPIFISKEPKKRCLSPTQVPITVLDNAENKTKRRIQPVKIADVSKAKVNEVNDDVSLNVDDKLGDVNIIKPLLNTSAIQTSEKVQKTNEEILTPSAKTRKTPVSKSSSAKKTKQPVSVNNTLFNYLKPINKTPSEEKTTTENDDNQKTCFKPQKLFAEDPAADSGKKIKVSSLFKAPAKSSVPAPVPADLLHNINDVDTIENETKQSLQTAVEDKLTDEVALKGESRHRSPLNTLSKPPPSSTLLEDTTDIPDDFVLQVEEVTISDDSKETIEKENETDIETPEPIEKKLVKEVPLKVETKRRIPLITLSSPKNKKKPSTSD